MTTPLNATEVRKQWSQFNDHIVRHGPRFVKRNRDTWAALSVEHLKYVFASYTFTATTYNEDDGSITMSLKDFDIAENGNNEKEALKLLTEELIEYAHEYHDHFHLYFHSPNRKDHFPFIMNVLIQENLEGVMSLIKCQAGET